MNIFTKIRMWALDRGIYDTSTIDKQYLKLSEEMGELAQGILKRKPEEITDAIGDMVVVLTGIAHFNNTTIEDCIQSAYDVISKRTGKMVNGTFLKD
jgi:NTP pyrophosphatase (non-canonical NTP hydrolase)